MPKPVNKKKRFITRGSETKFNLIHRSQRDPLAADSNAPQRLLQPINEREEHDARKEEQREHGVYYEDDYDYLQHLRQKNDGVEWQEIKGNQKETDIELEERAPTKSKPTLRLPSSVFATDFEEEVGLLNRAAPRSGPLVGASDDLREVLETLDDDFEVEEVLKGADLADEFQDEDENEEDKKEVELDDILTGIVNGEDGDEEDEMTDEEDCDSDFGYGGRSDDEEENDMWERETKFTNYSMSSNVVARSEHLTMLDDRFEKFYDEYEEQNTGNLEFDDIQGHKSSQGAIMDQILQQFEKNKAEERVKPEFIPTKMTAELSDEEDELDEERLEIEAPKEKWDAESILSTYSNIYHHPKLISERSKKIAPIQISGKTGMPKDVLGKGGLTISALKQFDMETSGERDYETCTLTSRVSELSIRNKHETIEEKRERKKAFKDYKKARREEKKANQQAFKDEQSRQSKIELNNRRNVQGQKIV